MLLESLRGSSHLVATYVPEDKNCIRSNKKVYEKYLSKCDTVYVDNLGQVGAFMQNNPELKILWTIRDPRDMALSKIYRGQPGNDSIILSDDATFEGCLGDIEWMKKIYDYVVENYSNRIMLVKMEDIILDFKNTIEGVCRFCNIPYEDEMEDFVSRFRGTVKATKGKRYKKLDKSQVALFKRKYEIYDGFYKGHDIDLELLFDKLEKYQKEFDYTGKY
tara:strand:+ start:87 stop:743 length:657 start_codon:yes stop_codon:yes gene_type:complete